MWVPQLTTAQVAVNPHGKALVACDEALSYLELDQRANQVAHYLRSLGVGPETLVGVCLERSVGMVVSALGILKAGGAYLPLDPAYPGRASGVHVGGRGSAIVVDAAASRQAVARRQMARSWMWMNCEASNYPVAPIENPVSGNDLAYVIYTSGSTGRPKGVQITHASLLNLVFWHQQAFGVQPCDRATQLASPAFDAAVWELWPYLTAGASVYLPADAVRNEPTSASRLAGCTAHHHNVCSNSAS